MEQIEKGEDILVELYEMFKNDETESKQYEELTNEFYSNIPHKFDGRKRFDVMAKMDTYEKFEEKEDTLQVMKDMLELNDTSKSQSKSKTKKKKKDTSILTENCDVYTKYEALNCEIEFVGKNSKDYKFLMSEIEKSVERSHDDGVPAAKRVFKLLRREEYERYNPKKLKNEQLLYHGSRACNWVGILSRGLLLPKIVVKMGVNRTDGGWLGDGLYFGDADTASNYAGDCSRGTSFVLAAKVALGKMKDYHEITYGLQLDKRYNSAHGDPEASDTEFDDNEYVIYDEKQHYLQYFVEFEDY